MIADQPDCTVISSYPVVGVSHEGIGKIKGVRVHKRYARSQRARKYTKDALVSKGRAST